MFHLFLCQNGRVYAKTRKERFTRSLVNLSTRQLVNLPTGQLVNLSSCSPFHPLAHQLM